MYPIKEILLGETKYGGVVFQERSFSLFDTECGIFSLDSEIIIQENDGPYFQIEEQLELSRIVGYCSFENEPFQDNIYFQYFVWMDENRNITNKELVGIFIRDEDEEDAFYLVSGQDLARFTSLLESFLAGDMIEDEFYPLSEDIFSMEKKSSKKIFFSKSKEASSVTNSCSINKVTARYLLSYLSNVIS